MTATSGHGEEMDEVIKKLFGPKNMNTESNNKECLNCGCMEGTHPIPKCKKFVSHQNHTQERISTNSALSSNKLVVSVPTPPPEWAERFEKEIGGGLSANPDFKKQVISFINSLLQQERNRVMKILEEEKLKSDPAFPRDYLIGHDAALTDAITHIAKENE